MANQLLARQQEMQPSGRKSNQNTKTPTWQKIQSEHDKNTLQRTIMDPLAATPAHILSLQKAIGNQAVSGIIQAKLTVGPVNDYYEREADRVAEQVVGKSHHNHQGNTLSIKPIVQRAYASPIADKDESKAHETNSAIENKIKINQGRGKPLPENTRNFMESRFGTDLRQVRIHTGPEARQLSQELKAEAFTHGKDIYMAPGRYNPHAQSGQRLLAHEITHVIQQGGTTNSPNVASTVQRWTWGKNKKKEEEKQQPTTPIMDRPSPTSDPAAYLNWLKTHPGLLSEKERQFLGVKEQQFSFTDEQMETFANKRKAEQRNELLALHKRKPDPVKNPAAYEYWLKGHPELLSDKEREYLGPRKSITDEQMDAFFNRRRAERFKELEALGTGKGKDAFKHSRDEAGDISSMIEDPRFQARYKVDRKSDHGNWFARKFKRGIEVAGDKLKLAKSYLPGQHSVVPGEDYEKQFETKGQKAKRIAKTAAKFAGKKLLGKIPFVGGGMEIASAVKDHKRQKKAEKLADKAYANKPKDAMRTPFLTSMSRGLSDEYYMNKITKGISAGISLVSDTVSTAEDVLSFGSSIGLTKTANTVFKGAIKPVLDAGIKGAKTGLTIGKLAAGTLNKDRKYRKIATAVKSDKSRGMALGRLAEEDPEFAHAMLEHLAPGQMTMGKELYTNTRIQKPKGGHTLKPSQVAKLAQQEKARLRERQRMGADPTWSLDRESEQTNASGQENLLGDLLKIDEKKWWED